MDVKLVWLVLGLLLTQCKGKTIQKDSFNIPKPNPSLHDDMRLTEEQKIQLKERGFFTAKKWPLVNNLVTVPYYFDNKTVPLDSIVRTNFRLAANIYANQTCIRWIEVNSTYTLAKVRIFRGSGCYSNVGRIGWYDNELSLGNGCEQIGTMLHEMGHCMGLFHTQSRPDRDSYVRVWLKNVQPGMEGNFEKSTGDLYDVPYDYKSMMHYGSDFFSINGSYTLSTIDPFAITAIGSRPDTFRYSDAAFLNRPYTCDVINAAKCPPLNCTNGGFVTQDCRCRCPENTVGQRCENITGPFFSDVPKCGGTVTTGGEISSFINGLSTTQTCIFKIEAPICQLPSITYTYAKFYWTQCYSNQVTTEISSAYFGITFCKDADVLLDTPLVSDKRQAAVYSSTYYGGSSIYGFRATVNFVPDPACSNVTTTTGTGTTTTRTTTTRTTTTTTTTTTLPPVSSCVLTNLGTNSFKYATLGYPNVVAPNTSCSYERRSAITDVIFTKVEVSYKLGYPDPLSLGDAYLSMGYSGGSRDFVTYHLWPTKVVYTGGSSPGRGFSVTHTPVSGLPSPCNGETITLAAGESRILTNPLVNYTQTSVRCAYKIQSPAGRRLSVQALTLGLTSSEYLLMRPYFPDYDFFNYVSTSAIRTWYNTTVIYYMGGATYTAWRMNVTVF